MMFYFAKDKELFINIFFIPILFAAYAYGARGGVITSILAILFVSLIGYISFDNHIEFILEKVLLWGCFLTIAGYIMGTMTGKINATYLGVITTLVIAMESRDPYTYGHSSRVAEVSVRIAKRLGLSIAERNLIRTAGLLHDIGKFGVREDILKKKEPLTPEEFNHIKQHTLIGVSILSPIHLLKNIIPYIYYHHEHVDGGGYLSKKGSEIPLAARILAVADAYDAMTTDRPYRKALDREKILKIFREEKGKQFDGKAVDALLGITNNLNINIEAPTRRDIRQTISLLK